MATLASPYKAPDEVAAVPPIESYRSAIEDALVYTGGSHTFEDVVRLVEEGKMQYWPSANSVVITEILNYPQERLLNFFLVGGGNLAEIETMHDPLMEWGRLQGCTKAVMTGRAGWQRTFLTREGWEATLQVYERAI